MHTSAPLRTLIDVLAGRIDDSPQRLDAAGWTAFVAEASRHGVSALAYRELVGCRSVQPHAMHALESHYLKNRLRNLRLFAHVCPLLEALKTEAVDVVVLKGAFLAQAIYPDAALRAMADADLLVRRSDLQRAARVLRAKGWHQQPMLRASGHHLPTFDLDGVHVELHWNIEDEAAPFAVDVAGLWERAVSTRIGRARALALSPEDLLLHLCMHTAYGHGSQQFDGGLRHLADIAAVVRHHDSTLDWHGLATRAAAWGVERCVWLCLVTTRDLLGAQMPQSVLDRLTPPQARWMLMAHELTLGWHYAELARCLPSLVQRWVDPRWQRLSRNARLRKHLLPARASLGQEYPRLSGHAALLIVAHWKDLAGDVLRLLFDPSRRSLLSRERERRALIGWLEGKVHDASISDQTDI